MTPPRLISGGRARVAGGLMALALFWPAMAHAQEWHLEAQGGQIRAASELSQASADTLLVGTKFDHPLGGLRLSSGVPTGAASPLWAAAGGWRRLSVRPGRVVAGVDLSGSGFLLRDRGSLLIPASSPLGEQGMAATGYALAGQLMPGIGFESPFVQVHGRSGISQYRSRLGADARDRTVWLSEVQAIVTPSPSFAVVPSLRHFRDGTRGYTYSGVTGMAARGPLSVWTAVGTWIDVPGAGIPWGVGGTLRVHPRMALHVSTRRDSIDPLYVRAPLRSWTAGVSMRLSGRGPLPPPLPAAYRDGRATIRLPVSRSRTRPRIAGDFTGWQPRPMERDGDHWTYHASVEPGVYHYAFVSDEDEWFVPEQTPGRRDDGMGGHVAVLVVTP